MNDELHGTGPPDGLGPSLPTRRGGDRGAALVEAAYVAPVFFLLVFGIIEFGLGMKSYLGLSNAVRDGAREASTVANELDADHSILTRIDSAISAINDGNIDHIVVFHASGPDDEPSATCKAGIPSTAAGAECNTYTAADFSRPVTEFGCLPGPPASPDSSWCPNTRKVRASDPPDWIGVWIQVRHDWVTGLFGSGLTMTDTVVMRVEPRRQ